MKKEIWLLAVLGLIFVILLSILFFVPAKPKQNIQTQTNVQPQTIEGLQIISPKANEEVSFPIKIIGAVSGNGWAGFEGQVGTVKLLDNAGKELATGVLTATTEWTSLPTTFETKILLATTCIVDSSCLSSGDAKLVFHNENPSGLPEKDKIFTLPIKLK